MFKFLVTQRITHEYSVEVEANDKVAALQAAYGSGFHQWSEEEIERSRPQIEVVEEENHA